ncbi:MAG: hypothetical protein SVR81_11495, partial [Chloroflexota bacterium]|nr:hypothetical protein [Chloroflexota bacterium]
KQIGELTAIGLIGEGVVGLMAPARYTASWRLGPAPLRDAICKLSGECTPLYWVDPQSMLRTDVSPDTAAFISTLYDPVNETYDLYLLSTSVGEWQRLTNTPEMEYLEDWSSTNQEILYTTYQHTADPSQPPVGTLFKMDLANGQQQNINDSCDISHAQWAKGQDDIFFGGICDNQAGIYQITSSGTELSLLAATDRTDFNLSPTGNAIVFNSVGTDGASEVLVLNLEDRTISSAPHDPGKKDFGGSWIGPDDKQLAFISARGGLPGGEYIWDCSTGQVFPAPWADESVLAWSTDREYRLVNSTPSASIPLYVLKNEETGEVIELDLPGSMTIHTGFVGMLPDNGFSEPVLVP